MKHIITAVLLALAIAAGLLLPEVFMEWQDRELETPQLISVTEPTLEWNPSKNQAAESEIESQNIARRLELFQAEPAASLELVPTDEEMLWATSIATDFLAMVCEVPPTVDRVGADYMVGWFEDNTTFPFWWVYVVFNDNWVCHMTIDAGTGAVLQCMITSSEANHAELFPESFERAVTEPDIYFEELVSQRFCDTLGYFLGGNDRGENSVSLSEEPDSVYISFADGSDTSVVVRLYVDLVEGIWFNHP